MKILAVFCLCIPLIASAQNSDPDSASSLPTAPKASVHRAGEEGFWSDKVNRTLVVADFSARTLDAYTSYSNATSSCHCTEEIGTIFGLWSMRPIVKNEVADYSFFVGVAAGTSEVSALIWKVGVHRHNRLLHIASRLLLGLDAGIEGAVAAHNCNLMRKE